MPNVGKISRGICRRARTEPSVTAITATTIVRGRRKAGWTRFIVTRVERRESEPAGFHARARQHNTAPTQDCKSLSVRLPPLLPVPKFGNGRPTLAAPHQQTLLRTICTSASALHHKTDRPHLQK